MENESNNIIKLIDDSMSQFKNANLAISNIILSNSSNDNICIFGGTLRDYFRNIESKDVDVIFKQEYDYNFYYNQSSRQFTDKFFNEFLLNVFNFGKLSLVERPIINNAYDYLNDKFNVTDQESEFEQVNNNTQTYNQQSENFYFNVDHIKYNLQLECDNDKKYNFILDVSFVKNFDLLDDFAPACFQDSLYLKGKYEITNLNNYLNLINLQIDTFCKNKNVLDIISDIKNNTIEICNIDTLKRCQKISRLITEGMVLKNVSNEELNIIRKKLTEIIMLHRNDLLKNVDWKQKRIILKQFLNDFNIFNYLYNFNKFKQQVYHLSELPNDELSELSEWETTNVSSEW